MDFSVLICTYNRHEILRQALTALVDRTIEKPDEIVVVNGGDDRADLVVSEFQGRHGVELRLMKTVNKNLAASRNIGFSVCNGDIVAMTDDDAEVYPDWIIQMKRIHKENPEAGGVGGAVFGACSQANFLSRLADIVTFVSPQQPGYVRTLPGVNISYKRAILEQVGLQDESLFRGEDVDYNWRVQKLGYKIFYHPAIRVLHHHRPSLHKFLQQHHMYGRAYYLVRRKWPDMYCVYPHQLQKPKDLLKAIYFFVAILHQPIIFAGQLSRWEDKIGAIPLLMANQVAWKTGMMYQKWLTMVQHPGHKA